MQVVRLDAAVAPPWPRATVTVGNFDGVHRGHQALLARTIAIATTTGTAPVVLTFDPHPARVLASTSPPSALMTLDQKAAALERLGIEALAVLPFDAEVAALTPDAFAASVLRTSLRAETVVVGANFRFGRGRAGDAATLRALGLDVQEVAPVLEAGERVSSSRIREALAAGDVRLPTRLLGRPHFVAGPVVRGDGRGRTIGVPTANVAPRNETLPALGVYAGWAWPGGSGPVAAAVNVGRRPTFGGESVAVEAHLLDFDGDLYGREVGLSFVDRLRGELRFDGAPALVAQIRNDVAAARAALAGAPPATLWDGL